MDGLQLQNHVYGVWLLFVSDVGIKMVFVCFCCRIASWFYRLVNTLAEIVSRSLCFTSLELEIQTKTKNKWQKKNKQIHYYTHKERSTRANTRNTSTHLTNHSTLVTSTQRYTLNTISIGCYLFQTYWLLFGCKIHIWFSIFSTIKKIWKMKKYHRRIFHNWLKRILL